MDCFIISLLLSLFCAFIYCVPKDILQTVKPPTSALSGYLVVITGLINTHILIILQLT